MFTSDSENNVVSKHYIHSMPDFPCSHNSGISTNNVQKCEFWNGANFLLFPVFIKTLNLGFICTFYFSNFCYC